MSDYDKLIDSITNTIHEWYITGNMDSKFPEDLAKRDAHKILEMVEEFQTVYPSIKQWRASD